MSARLAWRELWTVGVVVAGQLVGQRLILELLQQRLLHVVQSLLEIFYQLHTSTNNI